MKTSAFKGHGLVVWILIFAVFMDLVDGTVVNVALPSIEQTLHATAANLEWIVSGYLLAFSVLLISGGRLGDIYGRQTIFLFGIWGFTLSSLFAAVVPDAVWLIIARVLQGGFAAMMVPQMLSTVQVLYKPRERGPIFGVIGAMMGIAAVIGPLLGGWLVSANYFDLHWRTIFLINVPIGIIIFILGWRYVPNSKSPHPVRLDIFGTFLAIAGVFAVVYPLIEGRRLDWPFWLWQILVGSVIIFGMFVLYELLRQEWKKSTLLPLRLFKNRGFVAGLITQMMLQGSLLALVFILMLYLQFGMHFSAIKAGLTFTAFSLGAVLGSAIAVPFVKRLGKIMIISGGILQAVGMFWLKSIVSNGGATLSGYDMAAPLLMTGIGLTFMMLPLIDVALSKVPNELAGVASGVYSTFQQVGAALGVAVVGVVFFHVAKAYFPPSILQDAFSSASWVAIGGYVIATISAFFLPKQSEVLAHMKAQEASENDGTETP